MGRIVVTEFVTLDGVIEDPGGSEKTAQGGWAFKFERGDEGDKYKFDELMAADVLLLGRVTYEGFAAAWPNYSDEVGFAAKMNSMPKYVLSSTLEQGSWENSTVLRGDAAVEAAKLKAQVAGDILVEGSASLVHALQDAWPVLLKLAASIDRMNWLPSSLPANPWATDLWIIVALSPMLVWDIARNKKVHEAYWIWLSIFVPVSLLVDVLWDKPWWHATARAIMRV